MDEVGLKRAIQAGDKAEKFLENAQWAWDELDQELWKRFKSTKSDDQEKREEIFREYHGAQAFRTRFERLILAGKKAEEELKQQKVRDGN